MESNDIGVIEDETVVSKSGSWGQAHVRIVGD